LTARKNRRIVYSDNHHFADKENRMDLETERGNYSNPDAELVRSELGRLNGGDNNHAILSDGDGFLQTATIGAGYVLEYRDGSGYYGSASEQLSLAEVQQAFALYLSGDSGWKAQFQWERREEGQAADGPESSSGSVRPSGIGAANPLDSLVDNVKKKAIRIAKNKLRGLFRR
jgi:hypothetical protein